MSNNEPNTAFLKPGSEETDVETVEKEVKLKSEVITLDAVIQSITAADPFSMSAINEILEDISFLTSSIEVGMALQEIVEIAKKNKMKIGVQALRQDLKKIQKANVHFEDLNEQFSDVKIVKVGANIKLFHQTDVQSVINSRMLMTKSFSLSRPTEYKLYYTGDEQNNYTAWLEHEDRPTYNGIIFMPDDNIEISDSFINIWNGYSCKPEQGNIDMFFDLIENVACSGVEKEYTYLKSYIAHQFQNPTDKPGVAIILQGGKGTGKDTIIDSIGKLYNDAYFAVANKSNVTGNFNGHMANIMMLNVAEQVFAGSHTEDSVMKNLITNPSLAIEKKGVDAIPVNSYLRVWQSSNADWVVPASGDERRYFIPTMSDKHKQDTAFFKEYHKWYANGGKSAILHWALNYDISAFDVRKPPDTKALIEQKIMSLPQIDRAVIEFINTKTDETLVAIRSQDIEEIMNEDGGRYKANRESIGVQLRNIFGKSSTKINRPGATQVRGWNMKLSELTEIMSKKTGVPEEMLFDIGSEPKKRWGKTDS